MLFTCFSTCSFLGLLKGTSAVHPFVWMEIWTLNLKSTMMQLFICQDATIATLGAVQIKILLPGSNLPVGPLTSVIWPELTATRSACYQPWAASTTWNITLQSGVYFPYSLSSSDFDSRSSLGTMPETSLFRLKLYYPLPEFGYLSIPLLLRYESSVCFNINHHYCYCIRG